MYPPYVVSVAVAAEVTRSIFISDKTPNTNKGEVYRYKVMHVMYYRPFDRPMGL